MELNYEKNIHTIIDGGHDIANTNPNDIIKIIVISAVSPFPSRSRFPPPSHPEMVLIIPPLVANAYVNKKPIATDDIK